MKVDQRITIIIIIVIKNLYYPDMGKALHKQLKSSTSSSAVCALAQALLISSKKLINKITVIINHDF